MFLPLAVHHCPTLACNPQPQPTMIYLLDLALLSWVFWPLEFLLFLLLYATVKPTSRDDAEDFRGPGIVILVLILAAVWYRCGWPTWTHLFEGIGLYIVAGFFLSLYKYWWVLHDFKRDAPAVLLHFTPTIQLEKLNALREAEGDAPMANCRNAAAGSLKQRSPAECARRGLRFISYWSTLDPVAVKIELGHGAVVGDVDVGEVVGNRYFHTERVAALDLLGFHSIHNLFCATVPGDMEDEERKDFIDAEILDLAHARETLDIDLDGGVFKVNDTRRYAELGEGSKSPKWATAYKFPPERVQTVLNDIVIQIGRTGQVTPVAKLAPVRVGGVTVTSASLMNKDQWELRGAPAPGDTVLVQRSAEVIPELSSYPNGKIYTCPRCGFVGNLQEQERHHATEK